MSTAISISPEPNSRWAIISRDIARALYLFDETVEALRPDSIERVRRTMGAQCIETTDGATIRMLISGTGTTRGHGFAFDGVLLDGSMDSLIDRDPALVPCLPSAQILYA